MLTAAGFGFLLRLFGVGNSPRCEFPFGVRRPYVDGLHRELTERIIGAAIAVHKSLGPGLLESTYEECLAQELRDQDLAVSRQVFVPFMYKGKRLGACYRLDLLVEKLVIVEVKAVDRLGGIHEAQMLTYLRHTGLRVGLILNFNTRVLPNGIQRISL